MPNIGELTYKITGDTKGIDSSLKKTEKGLGKFGKAAIAAFSVGAAVALAGKIVDIGKKLIGAASTAEETRNKFNVVFNDVSEAANAAAEEIAEGYGLSQQASENYLSGVGDIVTGLGATAEEALRVSDTITRLGVDIDSFANLSGGAEQAVSALTSLFTGEREAAKSLGIVINDTNLKKYAEDMGKVYDELSPLERGFLSLELAQTQSTLAIGDFERSQDSFANQMRIAKSSVEDLSVTLGEDLLPAATAAVGVFNTLINRINTSRELAQDVRQAASAVGEGTATAAEQLFEYKQQLEEVNREILIQRENEARTGYSSLDLYLQRRNLLFSQIESAERLLEQEQMRIGIADQGIVIEEEKAANAEQRALDEADALAAEQARIAALIAANKALDENRNETELAFRQNLADTANLQVELALQEKAIEEERHAEKLQNLLDELAQYSQYAGNVGTIFGNLIKIQMAGDQELTEEKKRNIITLYRIQQAANIAQIAIDTASAMVRQYKDLPIYFAIPAMAITAAIGATQAAVVAATPPPALAEGGIVPAQPGGRVVQVAEAGQDEAIIPLDKAGGLGMIRLIVNLAEQPILDVVQSGFNRNEIVIDAGAI